MVSETINTLAGSEKLTRPYACSNARCMNANTSNHTLAGWYSETED